MTAVGKLVKEFRLAAQAAERPFISLCLEAARLRFGANRLGISEYLDYRAWHGSSEANNNDAEYIGKRKSDAIDHALNQDDWRALANDKLLSLDLMASHGIPVPETVAVYCPQGRSLEGAKSFASATEFIEFLTNARPFPVFAKPIVGTYGRAAFLLVDHDAARSQFMLGDGSTISVEHLRKLIEFGPFRGFLLQQPISQHGDVNSWIGSTISAARIMILFTKRDPELFAAYWKIAVPPNMTDNFSHGRTGNAIAWLDPGSGAIEHVVLGIGPHATVDEENTDQLASLVGQELPNWEKGRRTALVAARLFPGLGLQHWDVAFGAGGPLLIEVNTEADLGVPQLCSGRGLLNARLKRALGEAAEARRQHRLLVRRASEFTLSGISNTD